VDEAYLDVTAAIGKPEEATRFAREIKRQIWEQTELTASAGISSCKFLAKIALDAHKPDGLTVTPQVAAACSLLEAIPIEKFFGVGKVTADRLRDLGIQTGAELRQIGEERLRDLLGKYGGRLYRFACGEDERPEEPVRERKSVGKEVTSE
jgi:DNA polymerase IV